MTNRSFLANMTICPKLWLLGPLCAKSGIVVTHSGLRWSFLGNSRKLGNIFPLNHQKEVFIAYYGSHSPSLMSPKLAQSSEASVIY